MEKLSNRTKFLVSSLVLLAGVSLLWNLLERFPRPTGDRRICLPGSFCSDGCLVGEYGRVSTLAVWTYSITFRDLDGDGWGECITSEETLLRMTERGAKLWRERDIPTTYCRDLDWTDSGMQSWGRKACLNDDGSVFYFKRLSDD